MTNRIIKSLDCRKIILIFCILEVNFAISVITLFVVFNESFQKAFVDKSVCVKNIVHLIVLPAIKNPLFDVYFNRITALLTVRFLLVMLTYLSPFALFALIFLPVMRTYLTSFALFALRFFACYEGIFDFLCTLCIDIFACYEGIFDFLCTLCSEIFVCYADIFDFLCTLCIEIFACYADIFDFLCTLCSDIFACYVRINISYIFSVRSYFDFYFPFYI